MNKYDVSHERFLEQSVFLFNGDALFLEARRSYHFDGCYS